MQTALTSMAELLCHNAASHGHKEIVSLLPRKSDIDATFKDKSGRTPLSYAAGRGQKDIVELLLRRSDVDFVSKDKGGGSPLSWALGLGFAVPPYHNVVSLFLNRKDIYVTREEQKALLEYSREGKLDGEVQSAVHHIPQLSLTSYQ